MRKFVVSCSVIVLALLSADPARASVFDELAGTRSAAMGGSHRGVGTSNDTLYLNPAGMSIGRRYAVDFNYGYSPFDKLTQLNTSVVDSKTSPVGGGMGYTHTRGDSDGADADLHRVYIAASYPLTHAVAFGLTQRYIRGTYRHNDERRKISLFTNDVGLALRFPGGFGIGLSAHNILRTAIPRMTPLMFGGGVAWSSSPMTLSADIEVDARDRDNKKYTYAAGAEYFIQGQFPIRLGYRRAPFERRSDGTPGIENTVSGGIGWVSMSGALEGSVVRSLERPNNWSLVTALKFFL